MEDQRVGAAGAIRPSDADREVVEARLKTAVADGRLTLEEFADRMGFALSAESSDELSRVTSDLPAVRAETAPATAAAPSRPRSRAREQRWLVAVMGGFSTSRRWRPARTTNAVAVMGGGEVDLRSAEIDGDEVTINAVAVMGGIEVIVPRGVDVEMGGFAVMGGRDCTVDESSLVEGAPLVRVNGYALMGGIDVRNENEEEARERAQAEGGEYEPGRAPQVPQTLPRTQSGPNEQKSWWGKLALGAVAIWFVASGGPAAVTGGLPDDGFAMMGGGQVDVTQRVLQAQPGEVIPVDVGAIMGGFEVIVPPGTEVRNGVLGIMGGSNVEVSPASGDAPPGVVEVNGFALMGGVNITDDPDDGDSGDLEDALQARIDDFDDRIEEAEDDGDQAEADALRRRRGVVEQELDDLD